MDNPVPELVPAPSAVTRRISFWAAHRRRPAFLLLLVTGLTLFLIWLPAGTRASLWNAFIAQRGLVVLLSLFALLMLSLIWSFGQRIDAKIFTFFNIQRYPKWLDRLMWLATQLGNMLTAFIAAFVFFLLGYGDLALEIIFGTLTLWLFVESIKAFADRQRPFLVIENARVVGVQERGNSFPSGHTTQIFFLVTLLIHHFQPGVLGTVALYTVSALVGFTRIYVGAHYPRDVVAGLVLGSVWGILAALASPYWLALRF